jgi:hypothetical protein
MTLKLIGRLAGALALTVGLAGCMDITMDVEILSETNGKATTTSVMGADFYAMAKAGMSQSAEGSSDGFCQEEGATLTENADGSATCVLIVEGSFSDLIKGDDGVKFEVVSPGVVKASFSTADMKSELGTEEQDEETKAMMQAFFEGHSITLRISGKEVLDTNMTLSADKKSAETVIPFLDLINGTVDLPPELYATVRTN